MLPRQPLPDAMGRDKTVWFLAKDLNMELSHKTLLPLQILCMVDYWLYIFIGNPLHEDKPGF